MRMSTTSTNKVKSMSLVGNPKLLKLEKLENLQVRLESNGRRLVIGVEGKLLEPLDKRMQGLSSELEDKYGRSFTKTEDLDGFALTFTKSCILVRRSPVVFVALHVTFSVEMNDSLMEDIIIVELHTVVDTIVSGKAP